MMILQKCEKSVWTFIISKSVEVINVSQNNHFERIRKKFSTRIKINEYMFSFKKIKRHLFDITINVEKSKKLTCFVVFFNHCIVFFLFIKIGQ
jgi:hypothetical protein